MTTAMMCGVAAALPVSAHFLFTSYLLAGPPGIHERTDHFVLTVGGNQPGIGFSLSHVDLVELRTVVGVAVLAGGSAARADVGVGGANSSVRLIVRLVSRGFFEALGIRPVAGRLFRPDEVEREGGRVVVVSERFWHQYGDPRKPSPVGSSLWVNGQEFTIVGVLDRFRGLAADRGRNEHIWLPIGAWRAVWPKTSMDRLTHPSAALYSELIGRTRPGARLDSMRQDFQRGLEHLGHSADGQIVRVSPGIRVPAEVDRRLRRLYAVGIGGSIVIAVLSLLNAIAAMVGARTRHSPQYAIRALLGEPRIHRLAYDLTVMIAVGALAAGSAMLLTVSVASIADGMRVGSLVDGMAVEVDGWLIVRVTAFSVVLAAGVGGISSSRAVPRLLCGTRVAWVIASFQIAVGVLLATSAVGLVERGTSLAAIDLGVHEGVVFGTFDRITNVTEARIQALTPRMPGLSLAFSSEAPFDYPGRSLSVAIRGTERPQNIVAHLVTSSYFDAVGVVPLRGRVFQPTDLIQGRSRVAVLSEEAEKRVVRGSAVGETLLDAEAREYEVVGVVADPTPLEAVHRSGRVYLLALEPFSARAVFVRSALSRDAAAEALVGYLKQLDSAVRAEFVGDVHDARRVFLANERIFAAIAVLVIAVALGVAAVAVYTALSSLVRSRLHDVAIMLALGAPSSEVIRFLAGALARAVTIGSTAGLVGSYVVLQIAMPAVPSGSIAWQASAAAIAWVVIAAASLKPWRNAVRASPSELLRSL